MVTKADLPMVLPMVGSTSWTEAMAWLLAETSAQQNSRLQQHRPDEIGENKEEEEEAEAEAAGVEFPTKTAVELR